MPHPPFFKAHAHTSLYFFKSVVTANLIRSAVTVYGFAVPVLAASISFMVYSVVAKSLDPVVVSLCFLSKWLLLAVYFSRLNNSSKMQCNSSFRSSPPWLSLTNFGKLSIDNQSISLVIFAP
jgi:hypothetical protein